MLELIPENAGFLRRLAVDRRIWFGPFRSIGKRSCSSLSKYTMRNYSSYLVRRWLLDEESQGHRQVFEIEHIQTGSRTRVNSLNEAEEWLELNCEEKVELDEMDDDLDSSSTSD